MAVLSFKPQKVNLCFSQFETILLSLNARINKGDFWKNKKKIKNCNFVLVKPSRTSVVPSYSGCTLGLVHN